MPESLSVGLPLYRDNVFFLAGLFQLPEPIESSLVALTSLDFRTPIKGDAEPDADLFVILVKVAEANRWCSVVVSNLGDGEPFENLDREILRSGIVGYGAPSRSSHVPNVFGRGVVPLPPYLAAGREEVRPAPRRQESPLAHTPRSNEE